MNRIEGPSGVFFRPLAAGRSLFRCRVCGRMHLRQFGRLIAFALSLLALFFASAVRETAPAGHRRHPGVSRPAVAVLRAGPREEISRPAVSVSPVGSLPGEVPDTAVIWNRNGSGTYLWGSPGTGILAFLPNGVWVTLLGEWSEAGAVPFGAAEIGGRNGWLDMRDAHRMPQPGRLVLLTRPDTGVFLYENPGGKRLGWLPPGTPVMPEAGGEEGGWMTVRLLVGENTGSLPPGSISP